MHLVISDSIRTTEFYLPINKAQRDLVVAAVILLQHASDGTLRVWESTTARADDETGDNT